MDRIVSQQVRHGHPAPIWLYFRQGLYRSKSAYTWTHRVGPQVKRALEEFLHHVRTWWGGSPSKWGKRPHTILVSDFEIPSLQSPENSCLLRQPSLWYCCGAWSRVSKKYQSLSISPISWLSQSTDTVKQTLRIINYYLYGVSAILG